MSQQKPINKTLHNKAIKELNFVKEIILKSSFDEIDRCYWMSKFIAAQNDLRIAGLSKNQARDLNEVILFDYINSNLIPKRNIIGLLDIVYVGKQRSSIYIKKVFYQDCIVRILEKNL
jgi:hypothetical protein